MILAKFLQASLTQNYWMLLYSKAIIQRVFMKNLILLSLLFSSFYASAEDCSVDWKSFSKSTNCEFINYQTHVTYPVTSIIGSSPTEEVVSAKIRAGFMEENKLVPFKGNIIYFEGLADSMLNHKPLFSKLTAAGFRVIAFDYIGQGGSTGSMNSTRLNDIPRLGSIIYKRYARDLSKYAKPIVLGWSTGGLAAYLMAIDNSASKVILIAPGIVPNFIIGEQDFREFEFDKITLNTLTSKRYEINEYNPHVDRIFPSSPLKIKDFAVDLFATSIKARKMKINPQVKGLVLLSGEKDSYVNSRKGSKILKAKAPTFAQIYYPKSLHEIDNEVSVIADDAHRQILAFLL